MKTGHSRSTNHSWFLAAAVMCMGILGGVGTAEAAKASKVDICHLDADTEVFTKISVNGHAIEQHVGQHGDLLPGVDNGPGTLNLDADCNEALTGPEVLARAYIDKNRNGTYEALVDIDIAELLDTADDGVPSVGDTIRLTHYPTSFDPCPLPLSTDPCSDIRDFYPDNTIVVGQINEDEPLRLAVRTLSGTRYLWSSRREGLEARFHAFTQDLDRVFRGAVLHRGSVADGQPVSDSINIADPGVEMWGGPEPRLEVTRAGVDEDYWLQVEFPVSP